MYLELASLHLLIVSCHCFASYTIFQSLFDTTNTTTAPPSTISRFYDGIEEIMPLSRAEIERALVKRPSLVHLTEKPRRTSLVKPKISKRPESRKVSFSKNDPHHFSLALFEDLKNEVPTSRIYQQNYPAAFDDLTMSDATIAENMEVALPKSFMTEPRQHYKPDVVVESTVEPVKVEEINKTSERVTKMGPSVSGIWNWMFDNKSNTSVTSVFTVNMTASTTQFPNTSSSATTPTSLPSTEEPPSTTPKFVCPENDPPSNIGPYEVPTERDLVLFTKKILLAMFDSYHQKTFQFLRDIKEASKAAIAEDKSCVGDLRRIVYRQCLREISSHYEQHIKKLVNTLETDRHEIKGMTEGSVCSLNEMKKDPVHLIKTLAVEDVSLQFAFPGFLRLISSCRRFCVLPPQKKLNPEEIKKTKQKLNLEKEAMLKYMLTRNDYLSLRNKNWRNPKKIISRNKK